MKLYIIAGEASGDLHAANLIEQIKKIVPDVKIRAFGGDLMEEQGAEIVKHYKTMAFMGFIPVLLNLRTILNNLKFCKQDILNFNPDAVILVDYPGFNLKLAKSLSKQNLKIIHYISPTVWAWHKSRIKTIKKHITKLFAILPFEKDFYAKNGLDIEYSGHPLLDEINKRKNTLPDLIQFTNKNKLDNRKIIALLPGSRKQELKNMLPTMCKLPEIYKDYQFVIAGAPGLSKEDYTPYIKNKNIKIIYNQTYDLLKNAHLAVVTSGTATLETALFNTPQVVCYKLSTISYHIIKKLVNIKYISLVNLILDKESIKELIQDKMNIKNLKEEIDALLQNNTRQIEIKDDYKKLVEMLGSDGVSARNAKKMIEIINN